MATRVSIAQVQTPDRTTNQLQQNIIAGINQLQDQVLNSPSNGIFLIGTSLVIGDNIITHQLNRTPVGYIITSNNSPAVIYQKNLGANTITLNASAIAIINLFLF